MIRNALALVLPFAVLAACATPQAAAPVGSPGAPMVAGTVNIYRGVNVLPNSTNIDWSNASFGVSGQPVPTLSLFDNTGGLRPCWLRITVDAPSVPVVPGQGGTVTLTTNGVPTAGPSPWAVVFDNEPAGHWSIAKPVILPGGGSNASAGTVAGQVFRDSAQAGQVAILDGTVQGCQM